MQYQKYRHLAKNMGIGITIFNIYDKNLIFVKKILNFLDLLSQYTYKTLIFKLA